MSLAFVPLYIRYIGMEAYGLIGLFTVLQAWMILLDMGMKPALTRDMARFSGGGVDVQHIRDLLRTVETVAFGMAAAAAVAVWALSGWLAAHWLQAQDLDPRDVKVAISLMGLLAALRFLETIYVGSVVGLQRQVLENGLSSSLSTLRALGAVAVLAWISPTIQAFFLWQGIVSVLTVSIYAWVVYRLLPRPPRAARFSREALLGIWRFAAGMIVISLMSLLLTQVDKMVLSRILPLKVFGYYALAGAVASALYTFNTPITTAFYPRFVELVTQSAQDALRSVYHTASQLATVIVGTAATMLILFADRLLLVWTGDPALVPHVAPLLTVFAMGCLLNALMWIPYYLQLAHGWTRLMMIVNTVAVAVLVPAILVFVPRYGPLAAAWVWFTLNAGYVLVVIALMHRRLLPTEMGRWYREDVAVPLALAMLVAWLCRLVAPAHLPRIVQAVVLCAIGGIVVSVAGLAAPRVRALALRQLRAWRGNPV